MIIYLSLFFEIYKSRNLAVFICRVVLLLR
jgi:hypothetical protein